MQTKVETIHKSTDITQERETLFIFVASFSTVSEIHLIHTDKDIETIPTLI